MLVLHKGVVEVLVLLALREAVGNGVGAEAAQLLNHGQPLVLVHGVAGNEERQHVFHAGVVGHFPQARGQHAAGRSAITLAYMSAAMLPLPTPTSR